MTKSATFDEPAHIFNGCLMWGYGVNTGRPLYWLAGLFCPFAPALPEFDSPPSPDVTYRDEFFRRLEFHIDILLVPARIVIIELTLLLGALLYRWGKEVSKGAGGLLALGLLAFEPNMLAHGSLYTTDLFATLLFTLTLYLYYLALNRESIVLLTATGISLELALRSKPSAPVLLLMLGLMTLSSERRGRTLWKWLIHHGLALILILITASLIRWGLSGFSLQETPFHSLFRLLGGSISAVESLVSGPIQSNGWPAYMLGRRSFHGWTLYFPLLIVVKTPLPILIASLIGVIRLVRVRRWHLLAAFSLPFWMVISYTRLALNIGYRHILPAVPFLILLSTYGLQGMRRKWSWAIACFALWMAINGLGIYPHYLAYFNEIAGGPAGGAHFFTDSNLDWGQDLKGLRRWMEDHGVEEVYLSYFGGISPDVYGIRFRPLDLRVDAEEKFTPITPAPGIYAISVTNLTGQYLWDNPSVFSWFRYRSPIAQIGYSIWVFQVPPDPDPPRWGAVCLQSWPLLVLDDRPPLDPGAALRSWVRGGESMRLIPFNCQKGWPLAYEGGKAWLLIPSSDGNSPVAMPPVGTVEPVYRQENYSGDLLFTVFHWRPEMPTDTVPFSPLTVGGILRLERATFSPARVRPGENVFFTLVWRVLSAPSSPISLMAHLWDAEGRPVAVDDGPAVPPEHWYPADVLIQTHHFDVPSEAQPGRYTLVAGAYLIPSIKRLAVVSEDGMEIGNYIPLGVVEVCR